MKNDYGRMTRDEQSRFRARERAEDRTDRLAEAEAVRNRCVTRWVVTHVNREGFRTLTDAAQGRYTFATHAEALARLVAITNNSRSTLVSVFGEQAMATFEVRPCNCWPVNFDPQGIYFDE